MKKDNLHNVNWDIISNILTEKATEGQREEFKNWVNLDKSNLSYFEQIKEIWLKTGNLSHCYSNETDFAWELVKSKTIQNKAKAVKLKPIIYLTISAAAGLLILFFVGKSILFPEKTVLSTTTNTIAAYKLPDNSKLDINYNSEVRFNKKFMRRNRELWLNGEVFIDVEKMKGKPFIIHAQEGSFRVLGTSFNISSYKNDSLLSLYVKTGVVEFFPKTLKGSVKIKKGEQVHYHKIKRKLIKKQNKTENYLAWKTGDLVFRDMRLDNVAKTLERTFKTKIIFENENLKQLHFSANFKNKSLEKIIQVIALTFELEIEHVNKQIQFVKPKKLNEKDDNKKEPDLET